MSVEVYSKPLNKSLQVDRIIGKLRGQNKGPTVVFFGGIHGNETAGVFAIHRLFEIITPLVEKLNGSVYGIAGNLGALKSGERYTEADLNRLWTTERMKLVESEADAQLEFDKETKEQLEIFDCIQRIMKEEGGPYYFLDLHTTSSETLPFLTINDTLLNRSFSTLFPVPIILGIEEHLDGPLLSYINYKGYIAIGFESGQHDDLSSFENHLAFAYVALGITGCFRKGDMEEYEHFYNLLGRATIDTRHFYEITHRHEIQEGEAFEMQRGFVNFQQIKKHQLLAKSNGNDVLAPKKGRIFMPLYQLLGDDGFFVVRKTPKIYLRLSKFFRFIRFDNLLVWLPGVNWASEKKEILLIRKRIAKFFRRDFLHLLGYRSRSISDDLLVAKNREKNTRYQDYVKATWRRKS